MHCHTDRSPVTQQDPADSSDTTCIMNPQDCGTAPGKPCCVEMPTIHAFWGVCDRGSPGVSMKCNYGSDDFTGELAESPSLLTVQYKK